MINIIKVGMTSKGYRRFKCTACGTLWDADEEHFEQAAGLDLYYSTCPVCGLACGEQRQKEKPEVIPSLQFFRDWKKQCNAVKNCSFCKYEYICKVKPSLWYEEEIIRSLSTIHGESKHETESNR